MVFVELEEAVRRVALQRTQRLVINEACRTVRTDAVVLGAEIEILVWVVEWRRRTAAHELLHADPNRRDADVVLEMGDNVLRHDFEPNGIGPVAY